MTRKSIHDLGELQKTIMEIIWDLGEATARQIQEKIGKKKKYAYTSILTMMQRLEKSGWLKHRKEGNAYIYQPAFSLEQERTRSLKKVTDLVFKGDARLLFQHLVQAENLSDEDLIALKKIIDEKRKEKNRG
ncbi:MAG: BlaI/MecI/CopY family transcriptional regulator [Candidatus Omnitrophota bacterium]